MLVVTAKALELVPWLIVGQTKGKCITAGYSGNQLATGFWVAPLGFTISELRSPSSEAGMHLHIYEILTS